MTSAISASRDGPLTCAQRQLWDLDAGGAPPRALNLSYAVAIDGALDLAALEAAFGMLIQANEPLRTTYRKHDGAVVAKVRAIDSVPRLLASSPRAANLETAAAFAVADRARGFNLEHDLPVRAQVLELGPDQHILVLTMHHIASDGWSLYLLRSQLSQYYAAFARGEIPELALPPSQCVDLARNQQEWLLSPDAEAETRWWLDRLQGCTSRPPGLRPATDHGSAALREHVVAISDEASRGLRAFARQAGVSMFVLLLTAYAVLIDRSLHCAHAVIGTLVANRPTAASSQVMGAHYNTLLLPADLGDDPSLAECLLRVVDLTLSALDHQSLPLPVLSARLKEERGWDPARTPSVMFIIDRYPLEGLALAGCQVSGLYIHHGDGQFPAVPAAVTADLVFFVREAGERLTLSMLWRAGTLPDQAAGEIAQAYLEILAAMRESPELGLTDLRLWQADGAGEPTPVTQPARTEPTLRMVTNLAPVDALSPVAGQLTSSPRTTS